MTTTSLTTHLTALMRLAWPVVISRTGVVAIGVVDLAMVSYVSTRAVAELAISQQILMFLLIVGLGMTMGTLVCTSQAYGAGNYKEAGRIWRRSVPYAAALGVIGFTLCLPSSRLFATAGIDPVLIDGGAAALIAYGVGMPAHFVAVTCGFFLEAINRPLWVTASLIVANILNLILNAVLIFGLFGLPAAGATGAALATSIVRYVLAALLIWRIWTLADHAQFGIRERVPSSWRVWVQQRRIGYAAGASLAAEVAGFAILGLLAGRLGANSMAAYGQIFQVQSIIFMLASGIGTATTIRVGMAVATGNASPARRAAWTGIGLCAVCLTTVALGYLTAPRAILAMFRPDPAVLALAVPVLWVAGLALIVDGSQFVISHALRGYGETWVPTVIQSIAFIGVMTPLAAWLTQGKNIGIAGLFWGMVAGCGASVALQSTRLVAISNTHATKPPHLLT